MFYRKEYGFELGVVRDLKPLDFLRYILFFYLYYFTISTRNKKKSF